MNIVKDFFYISWASEPLCTISPFVSDETLQLHHEESYDDFSDNAAILLAISKSNIDKALKIAILQDILDKYLGYPFQNKYLSDDIISLQCRLLSYLIYRGDPVLNKTIGQKLDKLRKADIIGYDTARKLISILTLIPKNKPETIHTASANEMAPKGTYYSNASDSIKENIARLRILIEDSALKNRLEATHQKIISQRFSIGITGVMNAGKSTMLNALLGKEILGTSVVPETANLTVIKHSRKPKAKVNYWDKYEWSQIEKNANTAGRILNFIKETKQHFGDSLGSYITKSGKSEDIDIEELPSYTSATHSDKLCNLVKSVTLYTDLEFVEHGVEIVDTPGLDDPVMQREEITKSYLAECDLLCHLMNVGQSATKKDIDFIIDTLLYRNVSRLLIVITRIDMVTTNELNEVIDYTKSSIERKLESINKKGQLGALLDQIVFIPISGKMALMHKTGQSSEAIKLGYSLEDSGIVQVEDYFREILFGDNAPRAKLIISAAQKDMLSIINSQEKLYLEEKELLKKKRGRDQKHLCKASRRG